MKKQLFCSVLLATMFLCGTNAQTVITNDYGSPIIGTDNQKVSNYDDEEESLTVINLVYYGFDGASNYGLSDYFINPNNIGFEFNIRMNFKQYGNYNVDLGPNYSFKLWGQDNKRLFLTAAIGPSFRVQNVPKLSSSGSIEEETQYKFDLFANIRLSFNINNITISAGYFLWGAEFKLSDGYAANGFNVALGFSF